MTDDADPFDEHLRVRLAALADAAPTVGSDTTVATVSQAITRAHAAGRGAFAAGTSIVLGIGVAVVLGTSLPRDQAGGSPVPAATAPVVAAATPNGPGHAGASPILHRCQMSVDVDGLLPTPTQIDASIDEAGVTTGFVVWTTGPVRFWVGPTAESAAAGYGEILVSDGRESWIYTRTEPGNVLVGTHLLRVETPKGRVAWLLGNSKSEWLCPPDD
jgi:hypothetical protein